MCVWGGGGVGGAILQQLKYNVQNGHIADIHYKVCVWGGGGGRVS